MPTVPNREGHREVTATAALSKREAIHALSTAVTHTILALKQEKKSLTLDPKRAREVAEFLFGGLQCCLDALDSVPDRSSQLLVISGPLAEAKEKWSI